MKPTDIVDIPNLRSDIPDFGPGDEVKVHVKVVDIDRSAVSDIGIDWGGLTRTAEGLLTAHDQPILFGEVFSGRQPAVTVPGRRMSASATGSSVAPVARSRTCPAPSPSGSGPWQGMMIPLSPRCSATDAYSAGSPTACLQSGVCEWDS